MTEPGCVASSPWPRFVAVGLLCGRRRGRRPTPRRPRLAAHPAHSRPPGPVRLEGVRTREAINAVDLTRPTAAHRPIAVQPSHTPCQTGAGRGVWRCQQARAARREGVPRVQSGPKRIITGRGGTGAGRGPSSLRPGRSALVSRATGTGGGPGWVHLSYSEPELVQRA